MPSTCSTLLPTELRISDVEAHLVVDFLIDVLIQEVLFQTGEQSTFREFVHNICSWYDADLPSNEYATEPTSWRALVSLNICIACVGGPGSGKGTQCAKIVETFGYLHISAGEILRQEIASKSADGTMILNRIKEGKIVPSEVTVRLIQKEIESGGNHKFLIDGFPRNDENRRAFEEIVGVEPDAVLFFDCPEEEMVKRVLNRNQGRVDDNYDTVVKRLKVFKRHNLPVIDYYATKGKLYTINAVGTEDEIFERVRPVFTSAWKPDSINSP